MACKAGYGKDRGRFAVWCMGHPPMFCDSVDEARKHILSQGGRAVRRCVIEHGSMVFSGCRKRRRRR